MATIKGRNGGTLTTFEKGNNANPKGRGKGTLNSRTIIRKWLATKEKAENPLTKKTHTLTQMDYIVLKQLEGARNGDTRAFKELLDRLEGKSPQRVDLTTNGESLNEGYFAALRKIRTVKKGGE